MSFDHKPEDEIELNRIKVRNNFVFWEAFVINKKFLLIRFISFINDNLNFLNMITLDNF